MVETSTVTQVLSLLPATTPKPSTTSSHSEPEHAESYDSPPPSSGDSSSPALEDEIMSENDSSSNQRQSKKESLGNVMVLPIEKTMPPPSGPPAPGPMFLNFKRDLSLKVAKPNKDKSKSRTATTYKVNGVNILNKASVDGKTVLERQKQRRVRHNHIERLRRDTINNIINELATIVPEANATGDKANKGNVLKLTLDYVKRLQAENQSIRQSLESRERSHIPPPFPPPVLPPVHPRPLHLEIPNPRTYVGRGSPSPISPAFSTYSGYSASSEMSIDRSARSPNLSPIFPPDDYDRRLSGSLSPMPSYDTSPRIQPPPPGGNSLPSINLCPSPPPTDSQMYRSRSQESHWHSPPSHSPTYHNGPPVTPSLVSPHQNPNTNTLSWSVPPLKSLSK